MPKLVQKCGYISARSAAKYMRYIAKREGVEKIHGRGPPTAAQKKLITQILQDYPDASELFEYKDYCTSPTLGNASEFITMALDTNAHTMEVGDGYLKYIATRPRVELRGDHGLFGDANEISLADTMAEVAAHPGPVWTFILSLHREDAAALGFDRASRWRTLLLAQCGNLSGAMKIPANEFRWCAAYHDEGYHPHVHMMVWSADPKKGYLDATGIRKIRSALTNSIFQNEIMYIFQKKDLAYRDTVQQARQAIAELSKRIESETNANASIAEKIAELACALNGIPGKKVYSYLPKNIKELVDTITDELAALPDVSACYQVWNDVRDTLEKYYKNKPRIHRPLSEQKEFRSIKNSIVREAEQLRLVLSEDAAANHARPTESSAGGSPQHATVATPSAQNPSVTTAVIHLLHHISRIFRSSSVPLSNPAGMRMESKRRKKLMDKRLALGHKPGDHEEQSYTDIK